MLRGRPDTVLGGAMRWKRHVGVCRPLQGSFDPEVAAKRAQKAKEKAEKKAKKEKPPPPPPAAKQPASITSLDIRCAPPAPPPPPLLSSPPSHAPLPFFLEFEVDTANEAAGSEWRCGMLSEDPNACTCVLNR